MKSDIVRDRFCDRCKEMRPIHEWLYLPEAFDGWGGLVHTRKTDTQPHAPCGWVIRVPEAV